MKRTIRLAVMFGTCAVMAACGGGGDGGLKNKDPGNNDVGVVAAFGDSVTRGSECACAPYPDRLSGLIDKRVGNFGIGGSRACDSVARTQSVIDQAHPGFMLILYGVNDIIHANGIDSIISALSQMVDICKSKYLAG